MNIQQHTEPQVADSSAQESVVLVKVAVPVITIAEETIKLQENQTIIAQESTSRESEGV